MADVVLLFVGEEQILSGGSILIVIPFSPILISEKLSRKE